MIHARVTTEAIEAREVLRLVGHEEDGATLLFLGVVRNHNEGRGVTAVRYEAYEEMATEVLRTIGEEAADILGTNRLAVVHRSGTLSVGDVSVAIAVSSPHRAEAYEASRYVIEEIKKRLPVWKQERYAGGESGWVAGVPPGPDVGGGAR